MANSIIVFMFTIIVFSLQFERIQAIQCAGTPINVNFARDLRSVLAGFWDAGKTSSGYRYCVNDMCAACYVNGGPGPYNRAICNDAASAVLLDIGEGSSGWCDYPKLKGTDMFHYWTN